MCGLYVNVFAIYEKLKKHFTCALPSSLQFDLQQIFYWLLENYEIYKHVEEFFKITCHEKRLSHQELPLMDASIFIHHNRLYKQNLGRSKVKSKSLQKLW